MKRLIGTQLNEVSSVCEKLFDTEGKLGIESVLQFLWRHSKDLGAARDDGVGDGRELRDGFGRDIVGVARGRRRRRSNSRRIRRRMLLLVVVAVALEEGFEVIVMGSKEIVPH